MKRIIIIAIASIITFTAGAQKIKGQWRGFFNSSGNIVLTEDDPDNTEYVLELELKNNVVTGYSYSYFQGRKYYVICSLRGSFNKATKLITVVESARIKGFTPPGWQDCLQTHILTYKKEGATEILTGRWKPADPFVSDCGTGMTTLTRKTLKNNLTAYNKSQTRTPLAAGKKPTTKLPDLSDQNKSKTPAITKNEPPKKITTLVPNKDEPTGKENPDIVKKEPMAPEKDETEGFEKRDNNVIQTIAIESEFFKVDLYDNGDIDGDSVSLFYNSKLVLAHKRLNDKAISITLDATTGREMNELTMYAENLGTIPPNTALMIIYDGNKRYEVRIASDLKKSGTIRFIHSPNK